MVDKNDTMLSNIYRMIKYFYPDKLDPKNFDKSQEILDYFIEVSFDKGVINSLAVDSSKSLAQIAKFIDYDIVKENAPLFCRVILKTLSTYLKRKNEVLYKLFEYIRLGWSMIEDLYAKKQKSSTESLNDQVLDLTSKVTRLENELKQTKKIARRNKKSANFSAKEFEYYKQTIQIDISEKDALISNLLIKDKEKQEMVKEFTLEFDKLEMLKQDLAREYAEAVKVNDKLKLDLVRCNEKVAEHKGTIDYLTQEHEALELDKNKIDAENAFLKNKIAHLQMNSTGMLNANERPTRSTRNLKSRGKDDPKMLLFCGMRHLLHMAINPLKIKKVWREQETQFPEEPLQMYDKFIQCNIESENNVDKHISLRYKPSEMVIERSILERNIREADKEIDKLDSIEAARELVYYYAKREVIIRSMLSKYHLLSLNLQRMETLSQTKISQLEDLHRDCSVSKEIKLIPFLIESEAKDASLKNQSLKDKIKVADSKKSPAYAEHIKTFELVIKRSLVVEKHTKLPNISETATIYSNYVNNILKKHFTLIKGLDNEDFSFSLKVSTLNYFAETTKYASQTQEELMRFLLVARASKEIPKFALYNLLVENGPELGDNSSVAIIPIIRTYYWIIENYSLFRKGPSDYIELTKIHEKLQQLSNPQFTSKINKRIVKLSHSDSDFIDVDDILLELFRNILQQSVENISWFNLLFDACNLGRKQQNLSFSNFSRLYKLIEDPWGKDIQLKISYILRDYTPQLQISATDFPRICTSLSIFSKKRVREFLKMEEDEEIDKLKELLQQRKQAVESRVAQYPTLIESEKLDKRWKSALTFELLEAGDADDPEEEQEEKILQAMIQLEIVDYEVIERYYEVISA